MPRHDCSGRYSAFIYENLKNMISASMLFNDVQFLFKLYHLIRRLRTLSTQVYAVLSQRDYGLSLKKERRRSHCVNANPIVNRINSHCY